MKYCPDCGVEKPLEDFCKNKAKKDGRNTICNECNRARLKVWRSTEEGKRQRRINSRKWKYGVDEEQYQAMVEVQGGCCAICGKLAALVVDHDHVTGKVRGLLCGHCNKGIGHLQDDTEVLESAIRYLSRY